MKKFSRVEKMTKTLSSCREDENILGWPSVMDDERKRERSRMLQLIGRHGIYRFFPEVTYHFSLFTLSKRYSPSLQLTRTILASLPLFLSLSLFSRCAVTKREWARTNFYHPHLILWVVLKFNLGGFYLHPSLYICSAIVWTNYWQSTGWFLF